jgi:hypothetical protein
MLAPVWDSVFPTICEEWHLTDTGILFYCWLSKGTALAHSELRTTCTKKTNGKGFQCRREAQTPWYACSSTDSQEIPCILWDWKIYQHVCNSLPLFCVLSDESKQNIPPYFLKNLQSTSVFKTNFFFQTFQLNRICVSFLTCATCSAYQYLNATFCVTV